MIYKFHSLITAIVIAAFLSVFCAAGVVATESEYSHLCNIRRSAGNVQFGVRWYPRQGVELLVSGEDKTNLAVIHLSGSGLQAYRPSPDALDQFRKAERLATKHLAQNSIARPIGTADLLLKIRENEWLVYLENRLQGIIAAPFKLPGELYWRNDQKAEVMGNVRFQPVADIQFKSDFMIEENAPNQLYPWQIERGHWRIHTVMEDALERPESDLQRIERVPLTADKSPNFYSLKGGGADAILTTGYDFYDDYQHAISLQIDKGEAGLVFYYQDLDNYYAFTIDMTPPPDEGGTLQLWKMQDGQKQMLARIGTELFSRQWYRLRVSVERERIHCFLDGIRIAVVEEDLGVGGRVGVYTNTEHEIWFDDAEIFSNSQLSLRTVADLELNAMGRQGRFHIRPDDSDQFGNSISISNSASAKIQQFAVGRSFHRKLVLSADVEVKQPVYDIGLLFGLQSWHKPYYRFRVLRRSTFERYELLRIAEDSAEVVQAWQRDCAAATEGGNVQLSVDTVDDRFLRLQKNGELVFLQELPSELQGGAGFFFGPGTMGTVRNLEYTFQRPERYHEELQQNEVFRADDFMRHWSSPEGQWVGNADGGLWYKGDFISDFKIKLPWKAGGALHLGVSDDGKSAAYILSVEEQKLRFRTARSTSELTPEIVYTPDETTPAEFEIHHEGHWLWVQTGKEIAFRVRGRPRSAGTRVRTTGYTVEDMAHSRVVRTNVISDNFNEAPSSWVVNGGDWQIINRFQCTPSWSHMIGESADGLAALWRKDVFKGDLILEFYAGMRQGWYERAGDLNCTIAAATTSADSGYTVTCTEYDQNLSQNWSTLYRDGEVLSRTDAYLAPRRREGNRRKQLNPLLSSGRPIHGAWYYIKLRRIGNTIEYSFDDEVVMTVRDDDPLTEGMVGIWTFMNSMTLAQVQITFQNVAARPFEFMALPLEAEPAQTENQEVESTEAVAHDYYPLTVAGMPLDSLHETYWQHQDAVGHAVFTPAQFNASALQLVNKLGGGRMFLQADLPTLSLNQIAGWTFYLKCNSQAPVNFYYSIGKLDDNGDYQAAHNYFHRLNGIDFSDGDFVLTGESELSYCDNPTLPAGNWQKVQVWIPARVRPASGADNLLVRVEGFGQRQPSKRMAGIGGGRPGAAYAVRQLTPLFYGLPQLHVANDDEVSQPAYYQLRDRRTRSLLAQLDSLPELQEWLNEHEADGINRYWLRVCGETARPLAHEIAWIRLPQKPDYKVVWHARQPDTILLQALGNYADPRFSGLKLTVAGEAFPLEAHADNSWSVQVPADAAAWEAETVPIKVEVATSNDDIQLRTAARAVNAAPVLVSLGDRFPFLETFAASKPQSALQFNESRMTWQRHEHSTARYLKVQNRNLGERLTSSYSIGFSVAEYPLMQFQYQAGDMANLSLHFNNGHYVRLSEDRNGAAQVRAAEDLRLDEQWRTWRGFITDAFTLRHYDVQRFRPTNVTMGSHGNPDQTGRYSYICLDNLIFGPAVSRAEQLAMTPLYHDSIGVARVKMAVSEGPAVFYEMDSSERAKLEWQEFSPGETIIPELGTLQDGIHQVFLKAEDEQQHESTVTSIPFLLDRVPLESSFAFAADQDPVANGVTLRIAFNNEGGAPWAIEKATFAVAGSKQVLPGWRSEFVHNATTDALKLNYPLIFRKQLDEAKDGDTVALTVDDIVDGAGNVSPPLTVPIKVDYESDKTGPAWLNVNYSEDVFWSWNWDGEQSGTIAFSPGRHNPIRIVHNFAENPHLETRTYHANGSIERTVNWKPFIHPWLSFRMSLPQPRDKTIILLQLETNTGKTYRISLDEPRKSATDLNRTRTISWQAGKWERLSFNVREQLQGLGLKDKELEELTVTKINFTRQRAQHNEALLLDDLYIHAIDGEFKEKDLLKWVAYDASGVQSLEISCYGADDKVLWQHSTTDRDFNLGELRAKAVENGWLKCQAKDKAGNLSVPFWFPFPK